jgi:hypothetical protein
MYRDRADSTKAFMERWSGSDAKVAQITRWPHHVTATNLMRDIEDIFVPIANATRAFDPATIQKVDCAARACRGGLSWRPRPSQGDRTPVAADRFARHDGPGVLVRH